MRHWGMLVALVCAACGGPRTTGVFQTRAPAYFDAHMSAAAAITPGTGNNGFTAWAAFSRFEKGYQFKISLIHPKDAWVSLEGWEIWLEDASGRRIDPVAMSEDGVFDILEPTSRPAIRSAVAGRAGGGTRSYVVPPQTTNYGVASSSMDRSVTTRGGGPRLLGAPAGLSTGSTKHAQNFLYASFLVPELAATSPKTFTLVLHRKDQTLRFSWDFKPLRPDDPRSP